ncbi:hypothetical protein ACWOHG_004569 [Vibrio parahaemolyticus]
MSNIPEIRFILRFSSSSQIPAELTARILLEVEKSILQVEANDLVNISSEFPELTDDKVQELKDKLESGELKGLYLDEATTGSIILVGTLAGIAGACYWLLNQTLGEDIKSVWPETNFSKRFREFLLSGSKDKLDKLIKLIKHNIYNSIPVDIEGIKFDFAKGKDEDDLVLAMMVEFTNTYPTTRGKLDFTETDSLKNQIKKKFGSEGEGGAGAAM